MKQWLQIYPVIARYDDQLVDVINDGENGFFFKDESELPQLILKAMSMDLNFLKQNALKKASEYSGETFAKNVLEVYKKAILTKEYIYKVVSIFPVKIIRMKFHLVMMKMIVLLH